MAGRRAVSALNSDPADADSAVDLLSVPLIPACWKRKAQVSGGGIAQEE